MRKALYNVLPVLSRSCCQMNAGLVRFCCHMSQQNEFSEYFRFQNLWWRIVCGLVLLSTCSSLWVYFYLYPFPLTALVFLTMTLFFLHFHPPLLVTLWDIIHILNNLPIKNIQFIGFQYIHRVVQSSSSFF